MASFSEMRRTARRPGEAGRLAVPQSRSRLRLPAAASAPGKPPRLVLRFAVYTGIVLLLAGLAILWSVHRDVTVRAQEALESQARLVSETTLSRHLEVSDFVSPVTGARRAELDELFRNGVFVGGVLRARLFSPSGTITYSNEHSLIGTRTERSNKLRHVLKGKSEHEVTWVQEGGRTYKAHEALVPVRLKGSQRPVGALELYQDYGPVDLRVQNAVRRLGLILALALLALYASLFPILRRVTAQLEARNRRLSEQAEERERLLVGERAAREEAEAAQRLLTAQNERMRELDHLKDEFVSLVSHELRTPLTSIRGYLELVLEGDAGELTPEQRRFLEVVERNSDRLLALVGDLLFLAQIEGGKLGLELRAVDLEAVAAECIEAAKPAAEDKSIGLTLAASPLPPTLGDRARLGQVLDNLLSNALKFTPEGGRVEVRSFASNGHVLLEIEDSGIGIPAGEQGQLFERFFRSSNATTSAIPGTGLGLAIVKAIVERHEGRIEVESEEGVGSTFRVSLPVRRAREAEATAREAVG